MVAVALLLAPLFPAAAQNAPRKALRNGPLEQMGNPPAAIRRMETTPAQVSRFGAFTSYQVNVDATGANIVGDAGNEPSICVDPTNPRRMAVGWRQFSDVTSNFRQAGYAYSGDGGATWTFPGVLEAGVFRSDPVLDADSTGGFHYLSLLTNFYDDIWRSFDAGQSWTRQARATGGDKQWFVVDKTTSPGHGFLYQYWSDEPTGNNYSGRQFSRSTDGGLTWLNPIRIPDSPRWGTLDLDANGNLFLGGVNYGTGQIWCLRSSNAKNSALTPTFDQATPVNLGGQVVSSEPINPEGLVGQVYVGVDRSSGATNGNIYMLASVQPNGFGTGSDVMVARSVDGGQSFSPPRRVNDDPVNHAKWHWFGALALAPNGRLDAVWLDSRNAANNFDSQLFYSYSTDGGDTWSPNEAVSAAFNPKIGYPNQNKIGDYLSMVSDNDGADVAYTATFNGEQDVYHIRLAPVPPGPTYIVTADVNPAAAGSVTGAGTYAAGATVTLTATPASCFAFVSWTENNTVVSTSATYQFSASADRTLTANFTAAAAIITMNNSVGGTTSGGGSYACGSTATVTATADPGYTFIGWTENGTTVSNSASYSFTVSGDRTLTANFAPPVQAPAIIPPGGNFKKKVKVTMTCATTGAVIHYTTDGTTPTVSSPVYGVGKGKKNGISISGKGLHTIKAIGSKAGQADSGVTVADFTIN